MRKSSFVVLLLFALMALPAAYPAQGPKKESSGSKLTPVVLIHGLGGSDLRVKKRAGKNNGFTDDGYPQDLLKWRLGDPQNLQFDSTGRPRTDTASSAMRPVSFLKVPLIKDISDLSKHLRENGYELNRNLFEFYYDFRFSIPSNARKLASFVRKIKKSEKVKRVDIVGHSMGGLIAKIYVGTASNSRNVRRLIFVGSPHLGAPKTLKALRYGDNLSIPIIDGCKLKRVARNLPGMYNLLPGKKYFDVKPGYFFDDDDIDGDSKRGLLGFRKTFYNLKLGKETRCMLKPDTDVAAYDRKMPLKHLNRRLLDSETLGFHARYDNWRNPRSVEVFNIVGFGKFTLEALRERESKVVLIETREGDGTVPLWSAEAVQSDHTYYVNLPEIDANHSTMIGNKRMREQIRRILVDGPGTYIPNIVSNRPSSASFEKRSKALKKK